MLAIFMSPAPAVLILLGVLAAIAYTAAGLIGVAITFGICALAVVLFLGIRSRR